jgi:hypothetical protein
MTDGTRTIVDTDGVEFRCVHSDEITDEMAAEMIALFQATFGRWPPQETGGTALDYLRWKTSGPITRIASIQARVDGRLAFATTSWASWMRIGGARRRRVVPLDAAMGVSYQGRRIYSRSVAYRTRLVDERYDLSLHEQGTSNRKKAPLGRLGQTPLGNAVTRQNRILRPFAFCAERRRLWLLPAAIALAGGSAVVAAAGRGARRRRGLQPRGDGRFDARFDVLFEEAADGFDVICERTQDYLRWRYGDRRAGPFVVRSISEGDRLLGYVVLRLVRSHAFIADLLAVPGRIDVVDALIADVVEIARGAGATGLECWLSSGHPYRGALRRQGFIDSRRDVLIEHHAVGASAEDLASLSDPRARVHFQMGDTDLV